MNEIKKSNFKLKNIIKITEEGDNDISVIKQTSSLIKNIATKLEELLGIPLGIPENFLGTPKNSLYIYDIEAHIWICRNI